ncbi:C2H2 type zinc finger domain protein [Stagonosporopsis vannaccii]|nr:C2H2 type zinc finger domain protein [Stagonosporopsis vannaccii]
MPEQLSCEQCGSVFQRREHYLRHLRTHTKEKPFQCSLCGHVSSSLDSLSRHHSQTHVDPATQAVSSRPVERQRVSRACKRCSTSKIRCDGRLPCEKCSSSDSHCYYEEPKKRKSKVQLNKDQTAKRLAHANDVTTNDARLNDDGGRQQMPAIHAQPKVVVVPPQTSTHMQSPLVPTSSQPIASSQINAGHSTGSNENPFNRALDFFSTPDILGFHSNFDNLGWTTGCLDPYLWPTSFELDEELGMVQNPLSLGVTSRQGISSLSASSATLQGLPLTPASQIAEIYKRSQSPTMDKDAVEVRQFHATSIEVDAPLHFPDIDPLSLIDAGLENLAHVEPLSNEKVNAMAQLAEETQREPHHHPFTNLELPPRAVLDAWVQLYFEYFHPVFPIIHKATFSLPDVDPLLVLAVAGIGAQFSKVKNAEAFARSIHELVRRRSSSQCEKRNQLARTVWMTQVIVLNVLALSHSGDRRELEIAELLQGVPATLARRTGVFEDVLSQERIAQLQLPLERAWRLWAVDEERRRIGFGVWLCDFAFRAHFDLTTIMDPYELRNSLPQTEDRWSADTAQDWARIPPGLGSGRIQTLIGVCQSATWLSVWPKTGTLGKQVILAELMEQGRPSHPFRCHKSLSTADSISAREALKQILAALETQQNDGLQHDAKASLNHRVMCLAALMTCHAPATDLTVAALRQIYQRLDDPELSKMTKNWRESDAEGRTTVYYAARLLETLRHSHATHYAMPVYLLRATLTLWLYARLFSNSIATSLKNSSGGKFVNPNDVGITQWKGAGCSRIFLPDIPDLLSLQGRRALLSEAIAAMQSLSYWGVSKVYLHLLRRLQSSEAAHAT